MNKNTLSITISGLTQADILRLLAHTPVRDGISTSMYEVGAADDDMDDRIRTVVNAGTILASSITSTDLGIGLVTSTPAVSPEAEASRGEQTPIQYPGVRGTGYLASLVVDLPGNSTAHVIGGTRVQALAIYYSILWEIEQHHPNEISKIFRANGQERTVLKNGTTLRPEAPAGISTRGRDSAELVIVAARPEQYTHALHQRAIRTAAPKAGRIVAAAEGSVTL